MPITLEQAEQLLREGRRKQRLPQLHATVVAELPGPARRWIVDLKAQAAGDSRKLRAEWRDGVRDFGLLVVPPWMWAMAGDKKWTRLGFDLDYSQGTDVLIRDMMPAPLDRFRVSHVADETYEGEVCVRVSLLPRTEGVGPTRLKRLEMVVRPNSHPDSGTEVFVVEHRDLGVSREISIPKSAWQTFVVNGVRYWLGSQRIILNKDDRAQTTLTFSDVEVDTELDGSIFLPASG